jgi:hypothetical protein
VTREALVAAGRQIANQARSRGGFESNRLNERLADILAGVFPLSMSAPQELCSRWTRPSEPLDVDAPISYVLTDQGRSAITTAAVH